MSRTKPVIQLEGLERKSAHWVATFTYVANGSTWITATINIPDHLPDDQLVPYARYALNGVLTTGAEITTEWRADAATIESWKEPR